MSSGQRRGIRHRLLHAPMWVLALLNGSLFGLLMMLSARFFEDASWASALVRGAVVGTVFGAMTGPIQHRQQRGVREAAVGSPEGLSRRVRTAAVRGPVPDDPEVRAAAYRLALAQLRPLEQGRVWGPVVFLLLAGLATFLAVTEGFWWLLVAGAATAAAAAHRYRLVRGRRRVALLGSGAG